MTKPWGINTVRVRLQSRRANAFLKHHPTLSCMSMRYFDWKMDRFFKAWK